MPRLPSSLLRKARTIDPLLPPLLAPCRDLRAAQNELRWLREHIEETSKARSARDKNSQLRQLVKERASGKPLQYVLGTEYFGDLEIRCRPGVLIPRQETAASVTHLVQLLSKAKDLPPELRILDLCTGTGCIPLLFQHEFRSQRDDIQLRLLGVDISEKAIALAGHNLERVERSGERKDNSSIELMRADVLVDPFGDQTFKPPCFKFAINFNRQPPFWDILISNPPYISPSEYWKTTARSVRGFEPRLALVPPTSNITGVMAIEPGDEFYPRLLTIAREVEAKVVLFEVADLDQAIRVARMARDEYSFDGVEIWRDQPDGSTEGTSDAHSQQEIPIVGTGNARSVLCWRNAGALWLGKEPKVLAPALGHSTDRSEDRLQPSFNFKNRV